MSGWVKIHRKILEWQWFNDAPTLQIFMFLLLNANHAEAKWRGFTIERGQLVTSEKILSQISRSLSRQKIRTILRRLERCETIKRKSTSEFSIITICNYDSYQVSEIDEQPTSNQRVTNEQPTNNQRITNEQPTNNQRATTNKNNKEEKELQKGKEEEKKVFTPLPPKGEISEELENYILPDFLPLLKIWLQNRRTKKQSYKSDESIKYFYNRLLKYSDGDITKANEIISISIANNWSGIFELAPKNKTGNQNERTNNEQQQRQYEFANEIVELASKV